MIFNNDNKVFDMIRLYVERNEGIAPVQEISKIYGMHSVESCVQETHGLSFQVIALHDKEKKVPPQRIRCVMSRSWNRQKPSWLDKYKK